MIPAKERFAFRLPTRGLRELGGVYAQRGFNYQVAYTCLRLTDLLFDAGPRRVAAVRVEGLEDLDVAFYPTADQPDLWPEEYVQLKYRNPARGPWRLTDLRPILARFTEHLRKLMGHAGVSFRLVVPDRSFDREVAHVANHAPTAAAREKLANALPAELKALIDDVLLRLEIEISPAGGVVRAISLPLSASHGTHDRDFLGFETYLESATKSRLRLYDITDAGEAQKAFNELRVKVSDAAASPETDRTFTRSRISFILDDYRARSLLADEHGCRLIDQSFLVRKRTQALSEAALAPAGHWEDMPFVGTHARWEDIAAGRDFERDQLPILIEKVKKSFVKRRPDSFVIHGAPGEGKTALMMRVAQRLLDQEGALIVEILDLALFLSPESLERFRNLRQRGTRPIILLLDDIPEHDGHNRLLGHLTTWNDESSQGTPVVLLATAGDVDLRFLHVPRQAHGLDLTELRGASGGEIIEIARRFELTAMDSVALSREFFLVAVIVAAARERLEDAIRHFRDRVMATSPGGHRLFRCLSLARRLGLDMPVRLLERLDIPGEVLLDPVAHGLGRLVRRVSFDVPGRDRLGAAHRLLAERFLLADFPEPSWDAMYGQFVDLIEVENYDERLFIAFMLRRLLRVDEKARVIALLMARDVKQEQCLKASTPFELISLWQHIFRELGREDLVSRTRDMALEVEPKTSRDVTAQADLLHQRKSRDEEALLLARREALLRINRWLAVHPDDTHVLTRKLALLSSKKATDRKSGSSDWTDRQDTIDEVSIWLGGHDDHPSAVMVYVQYLDLVDSWANPLQRANALVTAQAWIGGRRKEYDARGLQLIPKFMAAVDRWRQKAAQHALFNDLGWKSTREVPSAERVLGTCDRVINQWVDHPVPMRALGEAMAWVESGLVSQELLFSSVDFATRWAPENFRQKVLASALDNLWVRGQQAVPIPRDWNLWAAVTKSLVLFGTQDEIQRYLQVAAVRIFDPSDQGLFPWLSLVSVMRVLLLRLGRDRFPAAVALLKGIIFSREVDADLWASFMDSITAISKIRHAKPPRETPSATDGTLLREATGLMARMPREILAGIDVEHLRAIAEVSPDRTILLNTAVIAAKLGSEWAEETFRNLASKGITKRNPPLEYAKFLLAVAGGKRASEAVPVLEGLLGFHGRGDPAHGAAHKLLAYALEKSGGAKERVQFHATIAKAIERIGPRREETEDEEASA